MHFNDVIANLGAHLRLPDLAPSTEGPCAVKLDALVYSFYPDPSGDTFLLRSTLGQVDPQDATALRLVLSGNFSRQGMAAGALGVDLEGQVFLTRQVACAGLDFPALIQGLERFVGMAEHWAAQLETVHAEGALS